MSHPLFRPAPGTFSLNGRQAPETRPSVPGPLAAEAPAVHGSRRRRLWEVAHKCHCPIVGVCFGVDELRALIAREMHFSRDSDDYILHSTAVGACETRGPLSELLHKTLEKRFHLSIRSFATAKTSAALRERWREALSTGVGIPAALWAALSHPACNDELQRQIYGDIHMLQHQVGTGTRAEVGALERLREENQALRQQLATAHRETEKLRHDKAQENARLADRIAELRAELAGKESWTARLAGQLDALRDTLPELKNRQTLARRASDAEARASALTAHAAALETEMAHLRRLNRQAEETIAHWLQAGDDAAATPPDGEGPAEPLNGQCILCVGGRSGAIDAYRQLVEQRGGRFLHHDGGLEENLHRIDGALAAADLVICQAGCISHNAYWRVKEQCKRSGKRCIFIKSAGVSSFARSVAQVAASAAESA